jgi:hypothetical protein
MSWPNQLERAAMGSPVVGSSRPGLLSAEFVSAAAPPACAWGEVLRDGRLADAAGVAPRHDARRG